MYGVQDDHLSVLRIGGLEISCCSWQSRVKLVPPKPKRPGVEKVKMMMSLSQT